MCSLPRYDEARLEEVTDSPLLPLCTGTFDQRPLQLRDSSSVTRSRRATLGRLTP